MPPTSKEAAGVFANDHIFGRKKMDQAMRLDRSISAGPRRGVEQACASIVNFVSEVVDERAYPDAASVRKGFDSVFPALRYLLTTRKFADPAIVVRMPELVVQISVSYDVEAEDNMEVPNLALLEKLPESATIEISLHSTEEVPASLSAPLGKASSKRLRFSFVPDAAAESDVDPDPGLAKPVADADNADADMADADIADADIADADIIDARIAPPEEDGVIGDPIMGDR
jgi:hypothetical protein